VINMFDYQLIGLFFVINLTIYFVITFPLDLATYRRNSKSGKEQSHRIDINPWMIITFLISGYMWVLFLLIPIDALFGLNIFVYQALLPFDIINTTSKCIFIIAFY